MHEKALHSQRYEKDFHRSRFFFFYVALKWDEKKIGIQETEFFFSMGEKKRLKANIE
jgi:hypothetical protein